MSDLGPSWTQLEVHVLQAQSRATRTFETLPLSIRPGVVLVTWNVNQEELPSVVDGRVVDHQGCTAHDEKLLQAATRGLVSNGPAGTQLRETVAQIEAAFNLALPNDHRQLGTARYAVASSGRRSMAHWATGRLRRRRSNRCLSRRTA
jgi:hypothetical protein